MCRRRFYRRQMDARLRRMPARRPCPAPLLSASRYRQPPSGRGNRRACLFGASECCELAMCRQVHQSHLQPEGDSGLSDAISAAKCRRQRDADNRIEISFKKSRVSPIFHLLKRRSHLPQIPQPHNLVVAAGNKAMLGQRRALHAAHAHAVRSDRESSSIRRNCT